MHLYAVWAGVLACVPALVSAARVPQGPKITTLNGASEVYAAGGRELAGIIYAKPWNWYYYRCVLILCSPRL